MAQTHVLARPHTRTLLYLLAALSTYLVGRHHECPSIIHIHLYIYSSIFLLSDLHVQIYYYTCRYLDRGYMLHRVFLRVAIVLSLHQCADSLYTVYCPHCSYCSSYFPPCPRFHPEDDLLMRSLVVSRLNVSTPASSYLIIIHCLVRAM